MMDKIDVKLELDIREARAKIRGLQAELAATRRASKMSGAASGGSSSTTSTVRQISQGFERAVQTLGRSLSNVVGGSFVSAQPQITQSITQAIKQAFKGIGGGAGLADYATAAYGGKLAFGGLKTRDLAYNRKNYGKLSKFGAQYNSADPGNIKDVIDATKQRFVPAMQQFADQSKNLPRFLWGPIKKDALSAFRALRNPKISVDDKAAGLNVAASKVMAFNDLWKRFSLFGKGLQVAESGLMSFGAVLSAVGPQLAVALAGASVAAYGLATALPMIAINASRQFLDAFAEFDRRSKALVAQGGSVDQALGLASMPGVSRMGAMDATIGLMATGFTQNIATEIIKGFSTGVSRDGGGQNELQMVLLAIKQIASKGTVSAEEINTQISERFPSFRKTMKSEFGTQDLGEINSMVGADEFIIRMARNYGKLSAAMDSPTNKLEIFDDSLQSVKESLGKGLMEAAGPALTKIAELLGNAVNAGDFDRIGAAFGKVFDTDRLETFINELPTLADKIKSAVDTAWSLNDSFAATGESIVKIGLALQPVIEMLAKVTEFTNNFSPAGVVNTLKGNVDKLANYWYDDLEGGKKDKQNTAEVDAYQKKLLGEGGYQKKIDAMMQRQKEAKAKRDDIAQAEKSGDTAKTTWSDAQMEYWKESLKYQRETAKNTTPDLQKMVLGGGNLGANGVSLVSLSSRQGRMGRITQVIQEVLQDEINDMMKTMHAKGAW